MMNLGFSSQDVTDNHPYPESFPEYPPEFELVQSIQLGRNTNNYEYILTSDLVDLRISTHDDEISMTTYIDGDYSDEHFQNKSEFTQWLEYFYALCEQSISIKISYDGTFGYKGLTTKGDIITVKNNQFITTNSIDYINRCLHYPIHNPTQLGDHIATLILNRAGEMIFYIFVFEEHMIYISHTEGGKFMEHTSGPLPSMDILINSLSDRVADSDETLEVQYYTDNFPLEKLTSAII